MRIRLTVDHEAASALASRVSWSLLAAFAWMTAVGRDFNIIELGITAALVFCFILLREG